MRLPVIGVHLASPPAALHVATWSGAEHTGESVWQRLASAMSDPPLTIEPVLDVIGLPYAQKVVVNDGALLLLAAFVAIRVLRRLR